VVVGGNGRIECEDENDCGWGTNERERVKEAFENKEILVVRGWEVLSVL
jgi:hypothetical protein